MEFLPILEIDKGVSEQSLISKESLTRLTSGHGVQVGRADTSVEDLDVDIIVAERFDLADTIDGSKMFNKSCRVSELRVSLTLSE